MDVDPEQNEQMPLSPRSVLFVSHDASPTGAPIFLLRFLRWFRENQQIPFRVLLGSSGDLLSDFQRLSPVDLFEGERTLARRALRKLKLNGVLDSSRLAALRQTLAKSNIGLIYCNTIANGRVLEFLSFLQCPVICHVHELDGAIRFLGSDNLELVKKHASLYIAAADVVKRNLVSSHGIAPERIRVIHEFIPADENRQDGVDAAVDVRKKLRIPPEVKLVCACGAIHPRKGTDLFLHVALRVAKASKVPPVHFVWIGGRPDQVKAMRKKTQGMSLADTVHFVGQQRDVDSYYDAADVFLLPSREDPFPLVMLEAALKRKPIVCFGNVGGAPEFVEEDAGFVVPALDVDGMAQKVLALLASAELCNQMGEVARRRVLSRHDLKVRSVEISQIIQRNCRQPGNGVQSEVDA